MILRDEKNFESRGQNREEKQREREGKQRERSRHPKETTFLIVQIFFERTFSLLFNSFRVCQRIIISLQNYLFIKRTAHHHAGY